MYHVGSAALSEHAFITWGSMRALAKTQFWHALPTRYDVRYHKAFFGSLTGLPLWCNVFSRFVELMFCQVESGRRRSKNSALLPCRGCQLTAATIVLQKSIGAAFEGSYCIQNNRAPRLPS